MESQILDPATPLSNEVFDKQHRSLKIIIASGQSKEMLGRSVTLKELDSMTADELDAYNKIYELNIANKVGENIAKGIIGVYSNFVNKVLPIDNVEKLGEDLNNDYILNSELKNIAGKIAMCCGRIMSLFSLTIITFQHVKLSRNERCKICNVLLNEHGKEHCNELINEHDKEHCKEHINELTLGH